MRDGRLLDLLQMLQDAELVDEAAGWPGPPPPRLLDGAEESAGAGGAGPEWLSRDGLAASLEVRGAYPAAAASRAASAAANLRDFRVNMRVDFGA